MTETDIGPSSSKLGKTRIVKDGARKGKARSSKKTALEYQDYGRDSDKKYASYAKSYQPGEMYQGASGTWYRNGRKVYSSEAGPDRLQNPRAVQSAYNSRVSRDIASRHRKRKRSR